MCVLLLPVPGTESMYDFGVFGFGSYDPIQNQIQKQKSKFKIQKQKSKFKIQNQKSKFKIQNATPLPQSPS